MRIGTRLVWAALLVAVVGACSSSETESTTTSDAGSTTTTAPDPRTGLVADPAAILAAVDSGEIAVDDADLYLTLGMWGAIDDIPLTLLAEPGGDRPQWDHSAITRLLERWPELDVVSQAAVTAAIDGFEEFVAPRPVSSLRSSHEGCVPTGTDVWICVGDSVSHQPVPDLPLEEAADVVRPWARDAAVEAWPKFVTLYDRRPALIKVFLSNLHANGGYTYGVVPDAQPEGAGGICHVYVDVLVPTQADDSFVHVGVDGIPDGTPLEDQLKATVAHEMFHCFQKASGWGFDRAMWEGSATWSEHHVFPEANTEVSWMTNWVEFPGQTFAARLYDTSFAFLYSDQQHGPDSVIDALRAVSAGSLVTPEADFEAMWHAISVAAWNRDPVSPLINDGGVTVPAQVGDLGLIPITPEAQGSLAFDLGPFSRDIQTFEFAGGTSPDEVAAFARLWLDLSQVPSDVRITVLPETSSGWVAPVDLMGTEWTFCRAAVGPCNDAEPTSVIPYVRLVLIVTNVDNGTERFEIPWNTYNPRLDGVWVRTEGPLFTNPGATAPYGIVGTTLGFVEQEFLMSEDTGTYSLVDVETGWSCAFAGGYVVGADPTYARPDRGDVDGVVSIDPSVGSGETFTNDCVYTSDAGFETNVSGLHIPVAAGPEMEFGFEIRDYDTLWVYAFERIYVYEKSD